jgi:HEAT repeat protein
MEMQQFDLFAACGAVPATVFEPAPVQAGALSDAALIEAIPQAGLRDCGPLADAAARRGLRTAVPALESLCRRFRGFGLERAVPEQVAALRALAELGGADAAAAVRRLIIGGAVQGPGLREAAQAAATLRCRLPEEAALALLRHGDPVVRADACRCVPRARAVGELLVGLLEDLHVSVATSAACALGRMGRPEARPVLLRSLRQAPDAEMLEAVVPVADDDATVLLGRIARERSELRDAALAALEDIDTPRAAAVLRRVAAAA